MMSEKQEHYQGAGKIQNALKEAGAMAAVAFPAAIFTPLSKSRAAAIATVAVLPAIGFLHGLHQAGAAEHQFKKNAQEITELLPYKEAVERATHEGTIKMQPSLSVSPA